MPANDVVMGSDSCSLSSEDLGQGFHVETDGYWNQFEANGVASGVPFDKGERYGYQNSSDEPALDSNGIPALQDGQIWIKRHPSSGQPSGFLPSNSPTNQSQGETVHDNNILPPYFPFKTLDDFKQAEIFSDFGDTDGKIDRQLGLASSTVTLKSAKEYHETLELAVCLWGGKFTSTPVITRWEGREFEHYVHFQPIFPALKKVMGDPELAQHMVYYPEEQWVHRPGTESTAMQVWEELWHGRLWWLLQDQIHPDQCILYIIIYIDETSVSTIGGVQVWPVYAWIGNLLASIRKQRTKKGGAILLGYLPKACIDPATKVKDLAGLRCQVYHDTLKIIFESLEIPSRYGAPVRCGDGVICELVPVIGAGSADYMEIIKMICILGHQSNFPCPKCLVPRQEQSKLTKTWPMRTVSETEALFDRANSAETSSERDQILKEQSLRSVHMSPLLYSSLPSAIIADPLHQIEQGIWGKHLWPWIRDQLPTASKDTLDARMKSIPRYPDLKHFPNGITALKYTTGKEHGVILRMIPPLLEDLIVEEHQGLILGTFRTLATIHMLSKYTTHTDISLEELDKQIHKFNRLHAKMVRTFDNLNGNYPKFHSLSHLVDIIRSHSTTDNYHTGLGEALHPQSKKDYRRTNHQQDFEIQMLHMHQEREAVIRIRARVDAATAQNDSDEGKHIDAASSWEGPNVQLGSRDRNGRQPAPVFIQNHIQNDASNLSQNMERHLRTFLYQQVGGFGSRIHFREIDLPLLDGMLVSIYRLITVGYTSLLDLRLGLDVVRVTDSWRNQGPRHDYVIAETEGKTFVAQLLKLFTLKVRGAEHSIAYVRRFKITRRSKTTGHIELKDTRSQYFIPTDWITRSCVVISCGGDSSRHVLWDLESPDMYIRLKHI
ncbi:hypothetical protein RSAG8_11788, partial [Rhizoctonia solani AG-8 WAC10335]